MENEIIWNIKTKEKNKILVAEFNSDSNVCEI